MIPATQPTPSSWLIAAFRTCHHAAIRRLQIPATACLLLLIHAVAAGAAGPQEALLLGPPPSDGSVEVSASFNLSDLTRIEGEQELCVFEGVLTLTWQDSRQAFDPDVIGIEERIYQGEFQFSEVYEGWWPQLILTNESGEFSRRGNLLRIAPDGTMTYLEELEISARTPMQMGAFPFDQQTCTATFEALGFDAGEVLLRAGETTTGKNLESVSVAGWRLMDLSIESSGNQPANGYAGKSSLHINIQVKREPGFLVRLIVLPLMMLVMLSWSVFWMDRESLGDRMDISFIGVLTVVAFQILVSEQLPPIAYFTLMSTFLYINYLLLCASVVVNLVVGRLDNSAHKGLGDRVDIHCRWIFPASYFGLIGLAAIFFL